MRYTWKLRGFVYDLKELALRDDWRDAAKAVLVTSLSPLHELVGRGAFKIKREMKLPWMDHRLRELVALAVLASLGCGLAE